MRTLLFWCCFLQRCWSSEYAHELLPGHPGQTGDFPSLPNLPFSVDADRNSDGASSESPLTSTAPAFPFHTGSVDESPILRDRLAEALVVSEVEQGVARDGAGEYQREQRVASLIGNTEPPPQATFTVEASLRWNPSSFAIQAGESYVVRVTGDEQRWVDGFVKVDAAGYDVHYDALSQCWVAAGKCRSYLSGATKRFADARWFALVCGVGEYVWKLQEAAKNARFLPLREEEVSQTLFDVGRGIEFVANHTGELICFANDGDRLYWNNKGRMVVEVERASWPPTQRSKYDEVIAFADVDLPEYLRS